MLSAASMYERVLSGAGTDVYHSRHSSPSAAARLRSASCFRASGSSVACRPSSVTGSMNATLSSRSRHEGDPFEQVHILLVLEQGAVERRNHDLLVGAAKRLGRDVLGEQELEPVEELGSRRFLLQARHFAQLEENLQRFLEQNLLQSREVNVDDARHRLLVRESDVVKEAAAQKRVGQLLFVVAGDHDQGPMPRLDGGLSLVDVELHAVELAQQIVGKLYVGLVDFVDQYYRRGRRLERVP